MKPLFRLPPLLLLPLLLLAASYQRASCASNSTSSPRGRVLALLPHPSQRFSRFSHLFASIEARGWEVVAKSADDPRLRLREWDTWLWDKVVVIPEEKGEDIRASRQREERREESRLGAGARSFFLFASTIECLSPDARERETSTSYVRTSRPPAPRQRPRTPRMRGAAAARSPIPSHEQADLENATQKKKTHKNKTHQKTSAAPSTPARCSSSSLRVETSSSHSRPLRPRTSAPWQRPSGPTQSPGGRPC